MTNPARSAKDETEQTSAIRPKAKAQPGAEGRTTKGTPATAAKRARASEAPAGDEPAAGHRRGLAAPARNMPEKAEAKHRAGEAAGAQAEPAAAEGHKRTTRQ